MHIEKVRYISNDSACSRLKETKSDQAHNVRGLDTLHGVETLSRIAGVDQERKRFSPRRRKWTKKLKTDSVDIENVPKPITREQMLKTFGNTDDFFLFVYELDVNVRKRVHQ